MCLMAKTKSFFEFHTKKMRFCFHQFQISVSLILSTKIVSKHTIDIFLRLRNSIRCVDVCVLQSNTIRIYLSTQSKIQKCTFCSGLQNRKRIKGNRITDDELEFCCHSILRVCKRSFWIPKFWHFFVLRLWWNFFFSDFLFWFHWTTPTHTHTHIQLNLQSKLANATNAMCPSV